MAHPQLNPYTPPTAPLGRIHPPHGDREDKIRAFASEGDNAPVSYYTGQWRREEDSGFAFNFAAFLFGVNWCLYRKLWWMAGATWVAEFVASGATLAIAGSLGWVEAPGEFAGIALVSTLGVRLVLGALANRVYLARAERTIDEIERAFADGAGAYPEIARRGGTSLLAVVLGMGANFAIAVLSALG